MHFHFLPPPDQSFTSGVDQRQSDWKPNRAKKTSEMKPAALILFLTSVVAVFGAPHPQWIHDWKGIGRNCQVVKEVKYREETQEKCSTTIK